MRAIAFVVIAGVPVATEATVALFGDTPISATPFDPIHVIYVVACAVLAFLVKHWADSGKEQAKAVTDRLTRIEEKNDLLSSEILRIGHKIDPERTPNPLLTKR